MELICLKCSDGQYLRICDDSFQLTSVDRASVYPVSELSRVKNHLHRFKDNNDDLHIVKLTITEEKIDQ